MSEKKHDCGCEHEDCNNKHHHDECDCGCEHGECDCGCEHEDDVVILQDQDGNDVKFHYVYNLTHEGKEYVYLQAADDEDEAIEIFAVETVEENGEFFDTLDPVDDDLYEVLYEKLLLVASEDACEDEECECHHEHCDCEHNK